MNEKVNSILNQIVEQFKNGDIPASIALGLLPPIDTPSSKWSFRNRILMVIGHTADARGFHQWHDVNRYVKKGSHAIHILVPLMKQEDDTTKLYGFKAVPVFRYEDTDGEPMTREEEDFRHLPFIERAEEWGIQVRGLYGQFEYYGYYHPKRSVIALATPHEKVFFHELAHAADDRIAKLKNGQDPLQEIRAELAAHALCTMAGKKPMETAGNSYRYIEAYAKKIDMTPVKACLEVLADVEKIISLIMGKEADNGV